MDGNQLQTATLNQAHQASLGESLVAARERRGLSREIVVQKAHIPALYLQMLEDGDYRLISDQLYLVPFLRKYASFLEIDPDETAMLLLREVQRDANTPSPIRLDQPLDAVRPRRNWSKPLMFGGLIAVIIGAYIVQSRHDEASTIAPTPPPLPALVFSPSLPVPQNAMQSYLPTSMARSDSGTLVQSTAGSTTPAPTRGQSMRRGKASGGRGQRSNRSSAQGARQSASRS